MQSYLQKFLWPVIAVGTSLIVFILHDRVFRHVISDVDQHAVRQGSIVAMYYSSAWLLSRVVTAAMTKRRDGRRKVPKLLRELITAALFLAATIATAALLLGQSAGGALASSGLIIAVLGFAIRNVLADVLAGVALGLEAPFKIGDWVEIDGTIRGRVIEIGWRTTRLLTRSDIYMILPNSQISRQKLTNYSAPRKKYQATVEIVLGYDIAIARGKDLLATAAASIEILKGGPKPEVRAVSYDTEGVRYAVRYWVPSFVDEADFRDAILVAVDSAIREQAAALPRRPSLVSSKAHVDPGDVASEEGASRLT